MLPDNYISSDAVGYAYDFSLESYKKVNGSSGIGCRLSSKTYFQK